MTYNVSMGTLNPTIPYHTTPQQSVGNARHRLSELRGRGSIPRRVLEVELTELGRTLVALWYQSQFIVDTALHRQPHQITHISLSQQQLIFVTSDTSRGKKGKVSWICIAPHCEKLASEALTTQV